MENKVVYIKLHEKCGAVRYFEESYDIKDKNYYYNVTDEFDTKKLSNSLENNSDYYLIAIIHDGKEIRKTYIGIGTFRNDDVGCKFIIKMFIKFGYCTSVKNIFRLSELDLESDFLDYKYINIENSKLIHDQIDFIVNKPYNVDSKEQKYCSCIYEDNLHELAQRNEYCRRQYNLRTPMKYRSEFQRDYERIVHSKAFRRMVDKAQVFSASKGDYYRTRMTHSQAVAQIAGGIVCGLRLNPYLTEAIALGHDIGHTPFGHQGERILDDILNNKCKIIKNADMYYGDNSFGGFKHNYQSLRVASILEEEYAEIYGMDLSFQVLEGILKHTKLKRDKYDLRQFIDCENAECELHFSNDICSTLEGQAVAIADEVAQRGHDLDDAFSSGAMSYEDFKNFIEIRKTDKLAQLLKNIDDNIDNMKKNNHRFIDENELRNSRVVSAIVSFFINDIIENSKILMDKYDINKFKKIDYGVSEKLIDFSTEAAKINKYLETIIASKVINSSEVSMFDGNAEIIVKSLFKTYYNNPKLLHKGTLRKLYINIRSVSENVVDFEYGNYEIVREELYKIAKCDLKTLESEEQIEYMKKRKILVRVICDFISGMTDTYAINEYNRIAKPL